LHNFARMICWQIKKSLSFLAILSLLVAGCSRKSSSSSLPAKPNATRGDAVAPRADHYIDPTSAFSNCSIAAEVEGYEKSFVRFENRSGQTKRFWIGPQLRARPNDLELLIDEDTFQVKTELILDITRLDPSTENAPLHFDYRVSTPERNELSGSFVAQEPIQVDDMAKIVDFHGPMMIDYNYKPVFKDVILQVECGNR
jgi:hypothetical protein